MSTSSLGGNIDPQQVEELPVQGRNWLGLALLAPGSRTASGNAQAPLPDRNNGEVREFQLNMDGQQISSELGTGNQPKFSQDSIAEFQFISNRFDATQGRSSGVQVNVITKSGTNALSGLFRTNFQSDDFNAEDPVVGRKLPISNQQYSTALGGPILLNKLHYYGNFEYERAPLASVWTTPYPAFNLELDGKFSRKIAGARIDYQVSGNTRLMGRVSGSETYTPFGAGSATSHPASTIDTDEHNREYLGSLTQVLSNRAVNEIKGGYSHYGFENKTLVTWSKHWQASNGITNGYPRMTFTGFSFNANANAPRHRDQKVTQIRDDFTFSYEARGRHDLRARRRVREPLRGQPELQPVRREHRRTWDTSGPADHPDARTDGGLVPGSVERGHLEFCSDLSMDPHLHDRHRGVPEPVPSAEVRRVGAG